LVKCYEYILGGFWHKLCSIVVKSLGIVLEVKGSNPSWANSYFVSFYFSFSKDQNLPYFILLKFLFYFILILFFLFLITFCKKKLLNWNFGNFEFLKFQRFLILQSKLCFSKTLKEASFYLHSVMPFPSLCMAIEYPSNKISVFFLFLFSIFLTTVYLLPY
jgi:hypothetical protein